MLVKDLKKFINSLPEDKMSTRLLFSSEEFSISGTVHKVSLAKKDLYYNGDDDPSTLYTKKQLIKEQDVDPGDIEDLDIEIGKGSVVVWIDPPSNKSIY